MERRKLIIHLFIRRGKGPKEFVLAQKNRLEKTTPGDRGRPRVRKELKGTDHIVRAGVPQNSRKKTSGLLIKDKVKREESF